MTVTAYGLLRKADVYKILDGDARVLFDDSKLPHSMPYLSGSELIGICNDFGIALTPKQRSRWEYVEIILDHCIQTNKVSDMFEYFFSQRVHDSGYEGHALSEINERKKQIVKGALDRINETLSFGGHELRCFEGRFVICEIGVSATPSVPKIHEVTHMRIKDLAERAEADIQRGELDSSLTKARTILEETFIHVISTGGEIPIENGDIFALYKQVKDLYNMHASKDMDKRFNMLLSGLEKVLKSITEMRNKDSDAHGLGDRMVPIRDYHARLMVNSAVTMADFVLSVADFAHSTTPCNPSVMVSGDRVPNVGVKAVSQPG